MSLPTVLFLGPAAVCVLSWLGAGATIPRAWLTGDRLLDALTRVAAGSAAVSLFLFGIGRAGAFDRTLVVAVTAVLAVVGLWGCRELWRGTARLRRPGRLASALLVVAGLALALDLVASTAPPSSADALVYHLALPKRWLELGTIGDPFWQYAAFYPLGIETLFAQGLAIGGGSTASALHAFLGLFAALGVFGLARELGAGDVLAGAAGAALFVLQGVVTWEATSTFIELGLTFYVVLAAWHAVRFTRTPGYRPALWTGFLAGATAGTKYLGPLAVAFLLLPFGLLVLRRGRPGHLAGALGLTALVGGPWYLKNLIVTGNPVYPLVFGGKGWTSAAQASLEVSQHDVYPGVSGPIVRVALLPIDLLLHGGNFDRGQYVGTAIFLFAASALFVRARAEARVALAAAAGYTVAWWLILPQARYLLPALAIMAAVGGGAAASLLRAGGRRRLVTGAVLAAAGAAWLVPSAALTRQLLGVTVGLESRSENAQRLTGTYAALQEASAEIGGRPLAFAGYRFLYHYPGRAIELGLPEFDPSLDRRTYLAQLRAEGVHDVLVYGQPDAIRPIRGCLEHIDTLRGRYVTSRSLAHSIPLRFELYSTRRCTAG